MNGAEVAQATNVTHGMDHVLGTVARLWRWPVKSMAGERVDALRVDHRGAGGDAGRSDEEGATGGSGTAPAGHRGLQEAAEAEEDGDPDEGGGQGGQQVEEAGGRARHRPSVHG